MDGGPTAYYLITLVLVLGAALFLVELKKK
jgi:hypothetical protein